MNTPYKIDDLARLQSFDPAAFQAGPEASQELCNFMLTLALAFNDLKDLYHASQVVEANKPSGVYSVSPSWGAFAGMRHHILRLIVALTHELVEFVRREHAVLSDPAFVSIMKHVGRTHRESWHTLVAVSTGTMDNSPLGKFLFRVRNKIAFHYDPKELQSGYKLFFQSGEPGSDRAYVSWGDNMAHTRFFFADAAASGYVTKTSTVNNRDDLLGPAARVMADLNVALRDMIHHFLQARKCSYKDETLSDMK